MPNWRDKFPSRYLKYADLDGKRHLLTVARVTDELVGQGRDAETKPVVYWKEDSWKPLVMNVTNCQMLEDITGSSDQDDWAGTHVAIFPTKTQYMKRMVDCVRLDRPSDNDAKEVVGF